MTALSIVRRGSRLVPFFILLGILVLLVAIPIAMLVWTSIIDIVPRPGSTGGELTPQWYVNLTNPAYLQAMLNSLLIGLGATALALVLGAGLAWLGARSDVPGKALVHLAGIVPLFVSSLVGALAWSYLASPNQGLLNIVLRGIGSPVTVDIFSMGGIIFVFGIYFAPYGYLLISSALSIMNPELEESARTHGATNFQVLRRITLPLVAPSIIASALLMFTLIVENFPVPSVLGSPAGIATIPSYIYRLMGSAPPSSNQAAAVGVLLTVLLLAVVVVQRRYLNRREYTTISGKGLRPRIIPLGRWRWPAFAFVLLYVVLAVGLPLWALIEITFRTQPYIPDLAALFDLSSFGVRDLVNVLTSGPFVDSVFNTLIVATGAAVLGGLLCFSIAYFSLRSRVRGRQIVDFLALAPLAIPAIVLGMGILWTWFMLPLPLYGTLLLLIIAYIGNFIPQGFSTITSSLRQVHKDLEESAIVSGASRVRASLTITMPLIRASAISTALLLFVMSIRELSIAVFLFTSNTRVLSIVIFDYWDGGSSGRAAAASLIYSVVLAVIVLVARRWMVAKPAGRS